MVGRVNFKVRKGLEVADSATIGGGLVASGLTYPSTDGTSGQAILTDGAGNLSFGSFSADTISDFNLADAADGDFLVYDDATEKWVATDTFEVSLDGGTF